MKWMFDGTFRDEEGIPRVHDLRAWLLIEKKIVKGACLWLASMIVPLAFLGRDSFLIITCFAVIGNICMIRFENNFIKTLPQELFEQKAIYNRIIFAHKIVRMLAIFFAFLFPALYIYFFLLT